MKIVAFSDTHGHHRDLTVPPGDVLVFAGDFTARDSYSEIYDFTKWWHEQPHEHKIFVAGNHDKICQEKSRRMFASEFRITVLEDSEITIDGIRFYGTPWQPVFKNWAFNLEPKELERKYNLIPQGINVLITHTPSFGYFDRIRDGDEIRNIGSPELLVAWERVLPDVHIFGHCHEDRGRGMVMQGDNPDLPWLYNVTICDENYNRAYEPMVIEIANTKQETIEKETDDI